MQLTNDPTLENFALILFFFLFLVGPSFSRLVWCSERFTWLTVVRCTLVFLGVLLFGQQRWSLVNMREHLNGSEHLRNFVSFFSLRVSVSVWNDTEKISMSLRKC